MKKFNSHVEHAKFLNLSLEEYAEHMRMTVEEVKAAGPINTDWLVRTIHFGPFILPNNLEEIKTKLVWEIEKLAKAPVEDVAWSDYNVVMRGLDAAGFFKNKGQMDTSSLPPYVKTYDVDPGIQACKKYREALPHFMEALSRCRLEFGEELVNKTLRDYIIESLKDEGIFSSTFNSGCVPEEFNYAAGALKKLESVKETEPDVKWYLEEEYPKWRKLYKEACGAEIAKYRAEMIKRNTELTKAWIARHGELSEEDKKIAEEKYGVDFFNYED